LLSKIRKEFPSIGGANIAHWKWAILGVVFLVAVTGNAERLLRRGAKLPKKKTKTIENM
jgi:hypothetical protein